MARRRTIVLTPEQRTDLLWHRDHDPRPYVRERCAAGGCEGRGWNGPYEVARHGLLKRREPDTVYAWLGSHQRAGVAGLIARQHRGPLRRSLQPADNSDRAAAVNAKLQVKKPGGVVALTSAGPPPSRWTC
jgi:hypothetical protein